MRSPPRAESRAAPVLCMWPETTISRPRSCLWPAAVGQGKCSSQRSGAFSNSVAPTGSAKPMSTTTTSPQRLLPGSNKWAGFLRWKVTVRAQAGRVFQRLGAVARQAGRQVHRHDRRARRLGRAQHRLGVRVQRLRKAPRRTGRPRQGPRRPARPATAARAARSTGRRPRRRRPSAVRGRPSRRSPRSSPWRPGRGRRRSRPRRCCRGRTGRRPGAGSSGGRWRRRRPAPARSISTVPGAPAAAAARSAAELSATLNISKPWPIPAGSRTLLPASSGKGSLNR